MVGDELGHHFDQRRALLGEVGVGPRLARGGGVVGVGVGNGVRIKIRGLGFGFRVKVPKLLRTILRSKKPHCHYYSPTYPQLRSTYSPSSYYALLYLLLYHLALEDGVELPAARDDHRRHLFNEYASTHGYRV